MGLSPGLKGNYYAMNLDTTTRVATGSPTRVYEARSMNVGSNDRVGLFVALDNFVQVEFLVRIPIVQALAGVDSRIIYAPITFNLGAKILF